MVSRGREAGKKRLTKMRVPTKLARDGDEGAAVLVDEVGDHADDDDQRDDLERAGADKGVTIVSVVTEAHGEDMRRGREREREEGEERD